MVGLPRRRSTGAGEQGGAVGSEMLPVQMWFQPIWALCAFMMGFSGEQSSENQHSFLPGALPPPPKKSPITMTVGEERGVHGGDAERSLPHARKHKHNNNGGFLFVYEVWEENMLNGPEGVKMKQQFESVSHRLDSPSLTVPHRDPHQQQDFNSSDFLPFEIPKTASDLLMFKHKAVELKTSLDDVPPAGVDLWKVVGLQTQDLVLDVLKTVYRWKISKAVQV